MRTPASPRRLRPVVLVTMLLALAVTVLPQSAAAKPQAVLKNVGMTISQTSGGTPTRFTFTADTSASLSSLSLTFPKDFDLSQATVDAVTLQGLKRTPVNMKQEVSQSSVGLTFDPPVASGATLRIQVHEVKPPNSGGTFALKADYVSEGVAGSTETPSRTFDAVTTSQRLSRWLDQQGWVESWNSVEFLRIFAKPQMIVLAVPLLFAGWLMSVALVGLAFPVAILGGLILAFMKMAKIWPIRLVASAYINVIRGTPLFLQIYIAFVGLPIAGFRAPLFITGVVVLALNSSAYLAEIFRAGIQSINKGQFEAASSLGMTYPQSMAFVIIPQTVKRVLPTMTSEFILLFKDTALLSAVGVFELMLFSGSMATRSGSLTPFVVAAVYYLIITIPLINWVGRLEARLAVSEGGQAPAEERPSVLQRMFGFGRRPVVLAPAAASAEKGEVS